MDSWRSLPYDCIHFQPQGDGGNIREASTSQRIPKNSEFSIPTPHPPLQGSSGSTSGLATMNTSTSGLRSRLHHSDHSQSMGQQQPMMMSQSCVQQEQREPWPHRGQSIQLRTGQWFHCMAHAVQDIEETPAESVETCHSSSSAVAPTKASIHAPPPSRWSWRR